MDSCVGMGVVSFIYPSRNIHSFLIRTIKNLQLRLKSETECSFLFSCKLFNLFDRNE